MLVVKIVGISVIVVFAIIAWIWQAAGIAGDVEENKQDMKEVKPIVYESTKRLDKLEIHYQYIKEDTEEIKSSVKQILDELQK